jgi:hypothetical protein
MRLINAIIDSPEEIKERINLRDEFIDLGINEVLQVTTSMFSIKKLKNL